MQTMNRDDVTEAFLAGEIEVIEEEWVDDEEDLHPDFDELNG